MNIAYYLSVRLQAFSVPFFAFKAINLATAHHFQSQSYNSGECVKIGETGVGHWQRSWGFTSGGLQDGTILSGMFSGVFCWKLQVPMLGLSSLSWELLLTIRKCIFHVSLLFLIIIPLLSDPSSMPPLNHLFLAFSPSLLPKCQTEICVAFFFLVKIL